MKKNGCTCPTDIQYRKKVVSIMKRTQRQDPFFDRQPPLSFLDDLTSPVHRTKPGHYGSSPMEAGEIDAHGLYIAEAYPADPKGLLETIYEDFTRFAGIYGIAGDTYPIRLCRGETDCFEAYRVRITAEETTITAADTEGIRRGLVWLEDTLRRRENAFLTPGEVNRRPHIRARITQLEELLVTEFPAVRQRIEAGESPLPYYDGAEDWPELKRYAIIKNHTTAVSRRIPKP